MRPKARYRARPSACVDHPPPHGLVIGGGVFGESRRSAALAGGRGEAGA